MFGIVQHIELIPSVATLFFLLLLSSLVHHGEKILEDLPPPAKDKLLRLGLVLRLLPLIQFFDAVAHPDLLVVFPDDHPPHKQLVLHLLDPAPQLLELFIDELPKSGYFIIILLPPVVEADFECKYALIGAELLALLQLLLDDSEFLRETPIDLPQLLVLPHQPAHPIVVDIHAPPFELAHQGLHFEDLAIDVVFGFGVEVLFVGELSVVAVHQRWVGDHRHSVGWGGWQEEGGQGRWGGEPGEPGGRLLVHTHKI